MLVTEEQAKELWCPEARISVTYADVESEDGFSMVSSFPPEHGVNRFAGSTSESHPEDKTFEACYCMGNKCMMWRWQSPKEFAGSETVITHGYCGKAGKP